MTDRTCACESDDEYDCWSLRYLGGPYRTVDCVHDDGGPCDCACHDEHEGAGMTAAPEIKRHTWGPSRKIHELKYRVCEICGMSDVASAGLNLGELCEPRPTYSELVDEVERLRGEIERLEKSNGVLIENARWFADKVEATDD